MLRRICSIVLVALLSGVPSFAATYFVRAGASGSNDGSSWNNAWPSLSSITWSGKGPGDVICVAGGNYTTSLSVAASGNSTTPLTVRRATAGDAVCGSTSAGWNASYDAQITLTGGAYLAVGGVSYVTVDGMTTSGIKVTTPNASGDPWGIAFGGTNTAITFRYIEAAGPCGSTPCAHVSDNRGIKMTSWNGSSYDAQINFLIQHVNVHGYCNGMWISNGQNGIIEYSRIADSMTADSGTCHDNVIATQSSTGMIFRFNEVTNWSDEGIMNCPSAACSSSWDIYGNIFHDPSTVGYARVVEVQYGTSGPFRIYNNTFYGISYAVESTANGGSFSSDSKSRNNIHWNSVGPSLADSDYDLSNGTISETHGQYLTTSPFSNPGLGTPAGFSLTSNTTAGTNLGSPYDKDLNGTTRATWSRGAFEYGVATPLRSFGAHAVGGGRTIQ